jgi:hypothetical protein
MYYGDLGVIAAAAAMHCLGFGAADRAESDPDNEADEDEQRLYN